MLPTRALFSKASRLPLTPKHGNNDFYKGTRAAYLPGGHRTGAPGKHVVGGKAKYRIIDEKVRYFVAPPISDIVNSPLKPYVRAGTPLRKEERQDAYGQLPEGGFRGEHYLKLSAQHHETKA
ncbi:ribosomal protein subunit L27 [Ceratobasidium sp. AG-Ba]|nr:ribosomal protein subunit L27 [Ceratobasidium sp. AG-Ba]QRW04839.1 ribosomal protein subunit L27 [Ceratobasidium sp. AG-Ba]